MTLAARVARSLEEGRGGFASRLLAEGFGRLASPWLVRPLRVSEAVRVIAVGGATLGGSGKTPLAIAAAQAIARHGRTVAFVGHAYGSELDGVSVVRPEDGVGRVGDEAIVSARALAPLGVPVVVAPTRQAALDHASTLAPTIVLDGVAQLAPRRAALALLSVEANAPWGAGACPPAGDQRASRRGLLAACDRVVAVGDRETSYEFGGRVVHRATTTNGPPTLDSTVLSWEEVRTRRVGLWTALARPSRVVRALARHGVSPSVMISLADHAEAAASSRASAAREARRHAVDLWIATEKCATRLPSSIDGVPIATLPYELALDDALVAALLDASA